MAGQGDADRNGADIRVRDGIIEARVDERTNRIVGAPPPTVGGGGDNGRFVFANVGELDEIIRQLTSVSERINQRSSALNDALHAVLPPAKDVASRTYAKATRESLTHAATHNSALKEALNAYVDKLREARTQMQRTEQDNTGVLTPKDGG